MSAEQSIHTEVQHSGEYHVASFIAHAMLDNVTDVEEAINRVAGSEVHGKNHEGKIVFTLESDTHKSIGKRIDQLRDQPGLINILPVYHQYEKE
jgi:nitrate reductase NapD